MYTVCIDKLHRCTQFFVDETCIFVGTRYMYMYKYHTLSPLIRSSTRQGCFAVRPIPVSQGPKFHPCPFGFVSTYVIVVYFLRLISLQPMLDTYEIT